MNAPGFHGGEGLELHFRTKTRYDYSYIESAALCIGEDILEVSSWGGHFLNGVEGFESFPTTMGSFATVTYVNEFLAKKKHSFIVEFGKDSKIILSTFKDLVSVTIDAKTLDEFKDCVGLIGSHSGAKLARDGKTVIEDLNEYGQEWQVRDTESKLFQNAHVHPQFPEKCILPNKASKTKASCLLLESSVTKELAQAECTKYGREVDMSACIFDILATGDLEMAQAGAF